MSTTTAWSPQQRARATAGIQATMAAKIALVKAHREEYEVLEAQERVARGLPAIKGSFKTPEQIAAQITNTETKLAKLRGEFAAVTNGHL